MQVVMGKDAKDKAAAAAKEKKEKAAKKKKDAAKEKSAAKKPKVACVEELDEPTVQVSKDYVNCRWEFTETGLLAIWNADDDDEEPSLSTIPGQIVDASYDKMCALVFGEDANSSKKTTVTQIIYC